MGKILEKEGRKQEIWHLMNIGLGEEFDYFLYSRSQVFSMPQG